jgi:hypothetical protein
MKMSTKKKVAAIVITTVALTAGTIGISSAASKTTKASITRVSTSRTTIGANAMAQGHGAEVASVLAALVTKGTITQAQSDAITAALAAAETAEHANDPQGGPEGKGPRGHGEHGERGGMGAPAGSPTLTLPATPKA